jgi:hypothetical protein
MLLSIVSATSSALLADPGITAELAMIKIEASFSIFKMTTPPLIALLLHTSHDWYIVSDYKE